MNQGYGLWKEYENEWFKEINRLTNAGFCVYFISHSEAVKRRDPKTKEEYEQLRPKGDKRTIDLIIDLADFIGYVKSNGVDSEGNEILSSCYFVETPEFLAGSRYDHMTPVLEVFSAENLQNAIKEAVEAEEKEGGKTTTFEEQKEKEAMKEYTYEEITEVIRKYMKALQKDHTNTILEILTEVLGKDVAISDTTPKQMEQLKVVLFRLQEVASDVNIKVE